MNTPNNFQGQGGSYVVNPDTGEAELVERTQDDSESTPVAPQNTDTEQE